MTILLGILHGIKAGKNQLSFIAVQMDTSLIEDSVRYTFQGRGGIRFIGHHIILEIIKYSPVKNTLEKGSLVMESSLRP